MTPPRPVAVAEKPSPSITRLTLSEIEAKGLTHLLKPKPKKYTPKQIEARFAPGHQGIKVSTVRDKTWYSVAYWHKKLEKTWPHLTENQRAGYSVDLMKMLTSKLNSLPVDPNDSKLNATSAFEMMKGLETPTAAPTEKLEVVAACPAAAPETHAPPSE